MRIAALLLALGAALGPSAGSPASVQARPGRADALATAAYVSTFNLDRPEALAAARELVALEPDRSRSHRVLATVLWTDILFRIGAITVDHFIGSLTKSEETRPPIPAEIQREFESSIGRAIELAEARLRENPDSVDARYEVGASYAIQASFRASIEGSLTAAFGSARKAYKAQEGVLERDPEHPNANVMAGTYRYAVSGLRFPSRWFAYLAGFSGDRERGIAMVEATASGPTAIYDGLPALLLIYTREKRFDDALAVAERLADAFPRNRLFVLEVGSAALRAGQAARAERTLRAGVEALAADSRARAPGEEALWYYKWGAALVELGRTGEAAERLDRALAGEPLGWVAGRIHLELGKVADMTGRRAEAVEAYRLARTIAARDNDPAGRDAAEALLSRPFRPGGRP